MTVELRPMGVSCNLGCTYCYQEPVRKAGNFNAKYDVDVMLKEAESTGQSFSLFGGEALLVPKKDLERFWKRGFELYGSNGMQTNGILIDDDHIELFKKYNVGVGVSIDGPNELNSLRVVKGTKNVEERTLDATDTIMKNLAKLAENGVPASVIITLHRQNGTPERLPRLLNFMSWLGKLGITKGNIHTLEVDKTMPDQEVNVLTQEENAWAFLEIAKFLEKPENRHLDYNPFRDINASMISNSSRTDCTWNMCDPMNTQAVYGIEGDGSLSNCGRTNKEGIEFYKADDTGLERYISLYNTPQELGGCQGCRFFLLCSGSCPGEAIDGDFRNKTIHCYTNKKIIGFYEEKAEKQGIIPYSKRKDLKDLEYVALGMMMQNQQPTLSFVNDFNNKNKPIRTITVR